MSNDKIARLKVYIELCNARIKELVSGPKCEFFQRELRKTQFQLEKLMK